MAQRPPGRSEDGIVAIYLALAIIALLAVTAVAIDIGNGWQQQRNAQSVADAASLSAAQALSDTNTQCTHWNAASGCAYDQGFYYAFGSLSVPRPTTLGTCAGVANCYAETSGGKTVVVYTNWNGNSNWVHVKVCWSTPTFFAKVVGVNSLSPCGSATAQATLTAPVNTTGCSSNDLSTAVNNPIAPGPTTLKATYNAALPIDPTKIIFIGTSSGGTLVKLNQGAGGYSLTYGSGNTATISYTPPAGLTTTASLFVTDTQGKSCGELAWSSCPVSTHDNFIETNNSGYGIADHGMGTISNGIATDGDADDSYGAAQLANSALIADKDDSVTPGPGNTVGPGATLSATYHDETDINQNKSVLFLNGVQVGATLKQLPGSTTDSRNAWIYDMSYTLPASTPNGWNSAFLYFWDADVNQTGGDCALTQWPFSFTAGNSTIRLVQ
jgi:Flp pilus assembly protein TadG